MGTLLVFALIVVLIVRWVAFRDRMRAMQLSIDELTARVDRMGQALARREPEREPESRPKPAIESPAETPPEAEPPQQEPPREEPPREEPPESAAPLYHPMPRFAPQPVAAAAREWETVLGGSWLNKLGVFVLVIGLALLLRYSFTQFGPLGRVAICLAASGALLAAGVVFESKERYRMFARGLLGGGWAGLYVTVYAMHAVEAARVVESAAAGAVLLLAVAVGMILHSLRYRSQTVTGMAYFVAFGTLAITDMASLPHVALVPLAASLLYVAHRFGWIRMAMFALVATYAVVVIRGDSGAPLWQAQTIFAAYWLMFEVFDVLHPEAWLLAVNAAGFLGLSLIKWQNAAPENTWMLLAASAAAYLVSALARRRSGKWQGASALTAALTAAAIFQKAGHQWVAPALLVEAEIFYLAGVRLRAPFLRWLGTGLFGVEAVRLVTGDIWSPEANWAAVVSLDAVVFYVNRVICTADEFYGYAGAAAAALVIGKEAREPARSVAWMGASAVAFGFGWWRRLVDFRIQGYGLLALGLAATAAELREVPLAVAAVTCYAGSLCAVWPGGARLRENERTLLHAGGGGAAVAALMAFAWRVVPGEYLGAAWAAMAIALMAAARLWKREIFAGQAYVAAALAFGWSLAEMLGNGAILWPEAAAVVCLYGAQFLAARTSRPRAYFALLATMLTSAVLYWQVSGSMLTVAFGIQGVILLAAGFPLRDRVPRISGLVLLLGCILKLFLWDLRHLETLPRIFSFLVLGVILLAVSWVYSRFRERVARYL